MEGQEPPIGLSLGVQKRLSCISVDARNRPYAQPGARWIEGASNPEYNPPGKFTARERLNQYHCHAMAATALVDAIKSYNYEAVNSLVGKWKAGAKSEVALIRKLLLGSYSDDQLLELPPELLWAAFVPARIEGKETVSLREWRQRARDHDAQEPSAAEVRPSPKPYIGGYGLFAREPIAKRTLIGWYGGRIYKTQRTLFERFPKDKWDDYPETAYHMDASVPRTDDPDKDRYLFTISGLEPQPGQLRCKTTYINHSSKPNAKFDTRVYDGPEPARGFTRQGTRAVAVVATRNIEPDEEILTWYSVDYAAALKEKFGRAASNRTKSVADNKFRQQILDFLRPYWL